MDRLSPIAEILIPPALGPKADVGLTPAGEYVSSVPWSQNLILEPVAPFQTRTLLAWLQIS